jgi:hypothetical protein
MYAGEGPSWLPAEPSTQSVSAGNAAAGTAHDDSMHEAQAHEDHSDSEEGAATSHAAVHLNQMVHGFSLQSPAQRYPYHGTVRNSLMRVVVALTCITVKAIPVSGPNSGCSRCKAIR